MSEKLYAFLLKLYPDHFRRTYGDEALRRVRDRASSENGFLSGFRLWLDLLLDLAKSLPREYTPAGNANRCDAVPQQRTFVSASCRTIAQSDSSVFGRYVISGVVLGVRLCSCTQRRIPGIVSGFAFPGRARAEHPAQARSRRRRITCSKFSAQFGGRRARLLHDRETGHSEQLRTTTPDIQLCESRRVRSCGNRWKSREEIQERTASLDSCACICWRSPVRLAAG